MGLLTHTNSLFKNHSRRIPARLIKSQIIIKLTCNSQYTSNNPINIKKYKDLIAFVQDRPGHDQRYAIDASKIKKDLGWSPQESFESGLQKTVQWFLENENWWKNILSGKYKMTRIGNISNKK